MEGGSETVWECPLVGCFRDYDLWVASCGVGAVSLLGFCKFLCEVGCEGVFDVLSIEPIVSLTGWDRAWARLLLPSGDVLLFY